MELRTMKIRAGARLNFSVYRADSSAVSATFIAETDEHTITDTVEYDDDGVAAFQFNSPDTDNVGEYEYQINENFATGSPDIYPNVNDCEGECGFPTLEICRSLSSSESS